MYASLLQSDTVQQYGRTKADTSPVGFELRKKRKDLSASESEECGHGEGGGVYPTLMQSDTVQSSGRAKADTRSGWVGLRKKPKQTQVLWGLSFAKNQRT